MAGTRGAAPLSRREREVAELVAAGLTDRQIAGKLFISERTVEGHLQQIRNKLGFDNRTQVASWMTGLQHAESAGAEEAEPAAPPNNLPAQLTSFVGRVRDLGETRRLLQRVRLLTITGPGGCGKTRLAVQAAAEVLHRYPAGLWFVELAPVSDRNVVPREIAAALGISEREGADRGGDPLEAIAAELASSQRRRRALVILDNCEHLAPDCGMIVERLLRACPDLTFLCTSREPLHVTGEALWTLGPLPLPDPEPADLDAIGRSEAVQLFLDRVSLRDPDFALDETTAADVVHLCQQLDGIPLALELAAARIGVMSFDQVLRHLGERLRGLALHGLPGRHETLEAAIGWSHDLLTDEEREVLRRLSVFGGGFTPEAAEAVCGVPAFDVLVRLADKSLVLPVPPRRERYRCLELIRRYAADRLRESGEVEATRRRHFDLFFAFAERAAGELAGPEQSTWLERLAADHDNLRAALEFSRGEPVEVRQRLVLALDRFWRVRGYLGEARQWAEEVLADGAGLAATPARARLLTAAAGVAWQQGDLARAAACTEESLAVWRGLGDPAGAQTCLANLGVIARARGDVEGARGRYRESLALAREAGDERAIGIVLCNLGLTAADLGEHEDAQAELDEALQLMRGLGDLSRVAIVLANLGTLALYRGRHEEAGARYTESLRLLASLGARQSVDECLEGLACVAAHGGLPERAMRLAGAAAGIREAIGQAPPPSSRRLLRAWMDGAREALGKSADRLWKEGSDLPEREAIALALEER